MQEGIVRLSPQNGVEHRLRMSLKGAYLTFVREYEHQGERRAMGSQEVSVPIDSATDVSDIAARLVVIWEARRAEEIAERTARAR